MNFNSLRDTLKSHGNLFDLFAEMVFDIYMMFTGIYYSSMLYGPLNNMLLCYDNGGCSCGKYIDTEDMEIAIAIVSVMYPIICEFVSVIKKQGIAELLPCLFLIMSLSFCGDANLRSENIIRILKFYSVYHFGKMMVNEYKNHGSIQFVVLRNPLPAIL